MRSRISRILASLTLAICLMAALNGCATAPPFTNAPTISPPVWHVAENPERYQDKEFLWGGMILSIRNEERYTALEMLGFPLDAKQQPQIEKADEGRYMLIASGFLEPSEFAVGRFITFTGRVTGVRQGELRGEPYTWPLIDTLQPHLWPKDFRQNDTRYSIGVGVRL